MSVDDYPEKLKIHFGTKDRVSIGKWCSLANNIQIHLGVNPGAAFPFNLPPFNWFNRPEPSNGDVVIGNDVWIGDNVIILGGVRIGDGAVVAANSRVVKNVAPYTVVCGNPAKCLKKRFSDEEIAALLALRWWDWDAAKIDEVLPLLNSGQIEQFLLTRPQNVAASP